MYTIVEGEIEGITPLLMHRPDPGMFKRGPKPKIPDPEDEARSSAYITKINGKETLYIPAKAVYACMINMAKSYRAQLTVGKTPLSRALTGSMRVEPEEIPLNKMDYEVDIQPAVVQRQMVMRARPKIFPWRAKFRLVMEESLLRANKKILEQMIDEAGKKFGLLDKRPQKRGDNGMFNLIGELKEIGEREEYWVRGAEESLNPV